MKKFRLHFLVPVLVLSLIAAPLGNAYAAEDTAKDTVSSPETQESTESAGETAEEEPPASDVSETDGAASGEEGETDGSSGEKEETSGEASEETTTVPETWNSRETQYPEDTVVDENAGDYGPDIRADTYCVLDGETGEVLMSCQKDRKMYPASCTKILTALLVLENVPDLDAELTFTATAIHIDPASSTLDPKAMTGEKMTVRDALYGMLLKSANECGAMLGEYVGGSEEGFAEMMNARAAEIGCKNTHFMNAYGIHHPEHYTTAYDLALILREAMKNPAYRELNACKSYTIPVTNFNAPRTFMPGHAMINGGVPAPDGITVIGGKTGSTPQAGKCLATAAVKDGFYTISTLMKSEGPNQYFDEMVLLEYTYALHEHRYAPVEWVPVSDHVTTKDGLRIRYSPSLNGGVDYTCGWGDTFERIGIYGGWSKILVNGKVRYLSTEFLESDDPEHVPVTEPYVYEEPETETEESETPSEEESVSEPDKSTEASSAVTSETQMSSTQESSSESEEKAFGSVPLSLMIPAAVIAAAVMLWTGVFIHRQRARKRRREMLENRDA